MLSASSPNGEFGEHGDDFEEHEYEQADDHAMVIHQQQQQTPEGPLPQTGGGQPASGPTSASIPTNDAQFFDQSLRPWEKTGYHLLEHDEACASELRWDAPNPEQREFHGLAANFVERWQHFAGDEEVFDSESDQHFAALRSLVRSFAAVCQKRVRELEPSNREHALPLRQVTILCSVHFQGLYKCHGLVDPLLAFIQE